MEAFTQFSKIADGGIFRARGDYWEKVPEETVDGCKINAYQVTEAGERTGTKVLFPKESLFTHDADAQKVT